MKVLPFNIPKPLGHNLIVQVDEAPSFYNQLHQHKEIQLSFIEKGQGKLIVGNSVHQYNKGDFFLIGSNSPHLFQNGQTVGNVKMISLFFTRESFGAGFFDLADVEELKRFFKYSVEGFQLISHQIEVGQMIRQFPKLDKLSRFIQLLQLLKLLINADKKILTHFVYQKKISDRDGHRMQAVFDYVINNFEREITLDTISGKAYMSPNAFCRYFKSRTNKTFYQFLIELRMQHACQLLEESDLPIAVIAERSGFNSISNFNRKFKALKGNSPTHYKKIRTMQ